MRIGIQTEGAVADSARANAAKTAGTDARVDAASANETGKDRVDLSSASSLVELAKSLTPADRHAKISELSAQFRSAQYQPDDAALGQAVVTGHLARRVAR